MKVRLLGLGAVGAPIAVRLAGVCDFAILLSPDRVARYWKDGCTVNGRRYDFPMSTSSSSHARTTTLQRPWTRSPLM